MKYGNRYTNPGGSTKTSRKERKRKYLLEMQNLAKKKSLLYLALKAVDISRIEIIDEDCTYRIKWYSFAKEYRPVWTGHNEDCRSKDSKNREKRICCETTFVVKKGEAGFILEPH